MDNDINLIKKFYGDLSANIPTAQITLSGVEQLELFAIIIKSIAKDPESAQLIMNSLGVVLKGVGNDAELGADIFIEALNDAIKTKSEDAIQLPKYINPMLVNILGSMVKMDPEKYMPNS